MANKIKKDEYELLTHLLGGEIMQYENRLQWYKDNEPENVNCIKDTSEYTKRLKLLEDKLDALVSGDEQDG